MNNPRHKLISRIKTGQIGEKELRGSLSGIQKLEVCLSLLDFHTDLRVILTKQTRFSTNQSRSDSLLKALLERAVDLSYRSSTGETLLHLASEVDSMGAASLLVDRQPDLLNAQDSAGATALHKAARQKSVAMVNLLVEKGADCNLVNVKGQTCMHEAVLAGNRKLGDWLLYKGAYKNRFTLQKHLA